MGSTISRVEMWSGSAGPHTGRSGEVKRPRQRTRSEISLSIHARELVWLDQIRRGYSIREIARREGLGCRRIQHGVSRARERGNLSRIRESRPRDDLQEPNCKHPTNRGIVSPADPKRPPRLVPLFPIGAFTPGSTCPHHGPIRAGSVFCCMVCSQSGVDDHPALKRDAHTDPGPERRVSPVRAAVRETRKQRRQRLNAVWRVGLSTATIPKKDSVRPSSGLSIPNS
jgi:hypothetical protein